MSGNGLLNISFFYSSFYCFTQLSYTKFCNTFSPKNDNYQLFWLFLEINPFLRLMDNQCDQCIIRHFSSVTKFAEKKLIYSSYCEGIRSLKRGEVLFKEGQYINGVFCIRSGVCKVSKMSVNGRNQIIKLIREGDLIGERSLISEEPSNLQATALNDIEVCFIPKEEIINDLKNDHDFTMNILKRLAVSLKEADN